MNFKLHIIKSVICLFIMGWFFSNTMAQKDYSSDLQIREVKALPFLQVKNSVEYQIIAVKTNIISDSCNATMWIEDNEKLRLHFKKGENSLEIPVKPVKSEKQIPVKIESQGRIIYQSVITLRPVNHQTCYILPHSHTDIGYTEIQTAVEAKQVQNLVQGMEIAKRTANYPEGARFVWNVEVGWAADLYLNRMNDQQRKEFLDAVSRGEVALNGMYLNVFNWLCRP